MHDTVSCMVTCGSSFECEKLNVCERHRFVLALFNKVWSHACRQQSCTVVWRVEFGVWFSWVLSTCVLRYLIHGTRAKACLVDCWKSTESAGVHYYLIVFSLSFTFSLSWTAARDWTRALRDCCEKTIVITLIDCWRLFVLFSSLFLIFFFLKKRSWCKVCCCFKDFYT